MCIHKAFIEECCSYSQRTVMCSAEGLYNSWIFLGHNTQNEKKNLNNNGPIGQWSAWTVVQLGNGLQGQWSSLTMVYRVSGPV